jgi:hypothetical protein
VLFPAARPAGTFGNHGEHSQVYLFVLRRELKIARAGEEYHLKRGFSIKREN